MAEFPLRDRMKVLIASRNKDKIRILKKALEEIHLTAEVVGIETNSRITNQPLDKETTKKGAINRARKAKKEHLHGDFWFGLEGGLHDYGDGYHLVTFACLIDKSGDEFIGSGEEIHLPKQVTERVRNGEWFGKAIRQYAKNHQIDENLVTRLSPFANAIQNAYTNYLVKKGNLGYRKKSVGIITDKDDNYLIVQLVTYSDNDWNFPGGGIEENESPQDAVLRELSEELGSSKFKIVKMSKQNIKYDWPGFTIGKFLRINYKAYRGQELKFFLVRFTGKKDDIKPDATEIRKAQWVKYEELKNHFNFPRQWKTAKKIIRELVD